MSVANIGMLQGPFRKRKWCLRDFADTQEGLRNHFAAKSYSRRAAKLASTLMFSASSLRHISGNFRRKYTLLYKKAAKSLRNKRVISQHFAKCFLQLGVIGLQWLQLLCFNSELHTVWSVGLLNSQSSKWYIVYMQWTPRSALNLSSSYCLFEFRIVCEDFAMPYEIASCWISLSVFDATHGSLALKAYQQNLYLEYYY